MDCQSGCRPKTLICAYFPAVALYSAGTALGQCLNVGIDGRTHATKILISTKNAVLPVWPNECNLQKVHARVQRI